MKEVIGRNEWFSIPEYGVDWFRGKIDTGRRDSFLHASEIRPFKKEGAEWVSFKTIDDLECEVPVVSVKEGESVKRYYVEVRVQMLDDEEREFLVCLSPRGSRRYLLTLGRSALGDFLVDGSRSQLFGKI